MKCLLSLIMICLSVNAFAETKVMKTCTSVNDLGSTFELVQQEDGSATLKLYHTDESMGVSVYLLDKSASEIMSNSQNLIVLKKDLFGDGHLISEKGLLSLSEDKATIAVEGFLERHLCK
jgi:hypothetical protein